VSSFILKPQVMTPNDTHKTIAMSHLLSGTTDGNIIHAAVEIIAAWVEGKQADIKYFQIILN
jgi:hypothetical protein